MQSPSFTVGGSMAGLQRSGASPPDSFVSPFVRVQPTISHGQAWAQPSLKWSDIHAQRGTQEAMQRGLEQIPKKTCTGRGCHAILSPCSGSVAKFSSRKPQPDSSSTAGFDTPTSVKTLLLREGFLVQMGTFMNPNKVHARLCSVQVAKIRLTNYTSLQIITKLLSVWVYGPPPMCRTTSGEC